MISQDPPIIIQKAILNICSVKILDYLFPKQCLNCLEFGEYLCKSCESSNIERNIKQYCHVCKEGIDRGPIHAAGPALSAYLVHPECVKQTSLDGVIVCCKYNKTVERLIAEIKYNFYTDIVNYILPYYNHGLKELQLSLKQLVIVPIPLHKRKQKTRGFNQAELIAKRLANGQLFAYQNLLIRNKNTKTQVGMSRGDRIENLKNVFEIVAKNNLPSRVVLIDDIMTTGTTLEECSKLLKKNGVKEVFGLVFARG